MCGVRRCPPTGRPCRLLRSTASLKCERTGISPNASFGRTAPMTLTDFRFETDADGIAVATWDMPGRSMNVITEAVMDELEQIIDAGRVRSGDQGLRHRLRQGQLLRRRRPDDAPGPRAGLRAAEGRAGRGGGDAPLLRGLAPALAAVPQARDLRQAVRGGDPAASASAAPSSWRCPAITASPPTTPRPASACRRSRSACFRAAAARSASRG